MVVRPSRSAFAVPALALSLASCTGSDPEPPHHGSNCELDAALQVAGYSIGVIPPRGISMGFRFELDEVGTVRGHRYNQLYACEGPIGSTEWDELTRLLNHDAAYCVPASEASTDRCALTDPAIYDLRIAVAVGPDAGSSRAFEYANCAENPALGDALAAMGVIMNRLGDDGLCSGEPYVY